MQDKLPYFQWLLLYKCCHIDHCPRRPQMHHYLRSTGLYNRYRYIQLVMDMRMGAFQKTADIDCGSEITRYSLFPLYWVVGGFLWDGNVSKHSLASIVILLNFVYFVLFITFCFHLYCWLLILFYWKRVNSVKFYWTNSPCSVCAPWFSCRKAVWSAAFLRHSPGWTSLCWCWDRSPGSGKNICPDHIDEAQCWQVNRCCA